MLAANDNAPPAGRLVRIIGRVGEDGQVTLTDATWRPSPATWRERIGGGAAGPAERPSEHASAEVIAWPNDPREP